MVTIDPKQVWTERFDEIIDVRSPMEFADDHLPGAINLPVLDDGERELVGKIHRRNGGFVARRKGAALVSARIARHLRTHLAENPPSYRPLVYCWREGMRSASMAHVLNCVGWRTTVLKGGYKAYRKAVCTGLEGICGEGGPNFVVIGGYTGSAKTLILGELCAQGEQVLDLEGLARHRGSILGEVPDCPQPSQRSFEHQLFLTLRGFDPARPVYVESESSRVGALFVPAGLWPKLRRSPLVEIEVPLSVRAAFLVKRYRHLCEDKATLGKKLSVLRKHHGAPRIQKWMEMVDGDQWLPLARDLLEKHYDQAYRRSRKRIYGVPVASYSLGSLEQSALCEIAERIRCLAGLGCPANNTL